MKSSCSATQKENQMLFGSTIEKNDEIVLKKQVKETSEIYVSY